MSRAPGQCGFTLIEMMITVVVVALLTMVALPSYDAHVRRSHRADARAALLEDAQFLERNFSEVNKYHEDAAGNAVTLPVSVTPREGSLAHYSVTLDMSNGATSATTFRLLATPVQGSRMDRDECGTLTLNQLGQRGASGAARTAAECWR
jgi:type IV pilus assembly protein PilE